MSIRQMKPKIHPAAAGQAPKNPCTAALKVIGDYWTISIVQAIGKESRRFCELERLLPDSNPVTLTSRLKKMESMGLITRTKSPVDKISVMYALTTQGKTLLPLVSRIEKFAEGLNVTHT